MTEKKLDKIDILLKSLARNDAYISNVNTKSTISLSFSAAIIAAVGLNYTRFIEMVECDISRTVLSVFVVIAILAFLAASIFSLMVVKPNLKKSEQKNIFSFVDIHDVHKNVDSYIKEIELVDYDSFMRDLGGLNYNISKIVLAKNKIQGRAIYAMVFGSVFLVLAILIVVFG